MALAVTHALKREPTREDFDLTRTKRIPEINGSFVFLGRLYLGTISRHTALILGIPDVFLFSPLKHLATTTPEIAIVLFGSNWRTF